VICRTDCGYAVLDKEGRVVGEIERETRRRWSAWMNIEPDSSLASRLGSYPTIRMAALAISDMLGSTRE
jgi:hypothetical protein